MKNEFREGHRRSHGMLTEGRFAIGVLCGVIFSVGFTLMPAARGALDDFSAFVLQLPTVAVALVSLLVAFNAFTEQRRMRQAGTDPVLIAHLRPDDFQPMLVHLVITNVGAGAAMNVKFSVSRPAGGSRRGQVITDILGVEREVAVILQGDAVKYALGIGHELLRDPPLSPISVHLEYFDIEAEQYTSEHRVDVQELRDRPASEPPATKAARELETLRQAVQRIQGELRGIRVALQPPPADRQAAED